MRTINAGVLGASQGFKVRPALRVTVQSDRARWADLHDIEDLSDRPTACRLYGGEGWRARLNLTGGVAFAALDDLDDEDQWDSAAFSTIVAASTCDYPSDVAIERLGAGLLRIGYVDASGEVFVIESSDGGDNWGSAVSVVATGGAARIALAGPWILVQLGEIVAYSKSFGGAVSGTSYTLQDAEAADWECSTNGGITAAYHSAISAYAVLFCDGGVYRATLTAAGVWSVPELTYPGGEQIPPADAGCHSPSMASDGTWIHATWVDAYSTAVGGFERANVRASRDGVHWGLECGLGLDVTSHRVYPVAYDADTGRLLVSCEYKVLEGHRYDAGDTSSYIVSEDVIEYTSARLGQSIGRVHVELIDRAGAWRPIGQGAVGEPVDILSTLHVSRGWTVGGTTYWYRAVPWYITETNRHEGMTPGVVEIDGTDSWGLVGMFYPQMVLQYEDRSVLWLIEEVCAKLGLAVEEDGDSGWDEIVDRFVWNPTVSARAVLLQLLAMGGGVGRFDEEGTLQVAVWPVSTPSPPEIGPSEIMRGGLGLGNIEGTITGVRGSEHQGWAESGASGRRLGLRLGRARVAWYASSQALVDAMAAVTAALDIASGYWDTVDVPMRADLEVFDGVLLDAPGFAAPVARVVMGIEEEWRAQQGRFVSRVAMGQSYA